MRESPTAKIRRLQNVINSLTTALAGCRGARAAIEAELALAKDTEKTLRDANGGLQSLTSELRCIIAAALLGRRS